MILIFDYFETVVKTHSMDFNRGLKVLWEKYYKDKCDFEEIKKVGDEQFLILLDLHKKGLEYRFVADELPEYAKKFGGEVVPMSSDEEADFLMLCNDMEVMPGMADVLETLQEKGIPMYILSNSGFTAAALTKVLERLGIGKYFKKVWSSCDYGRIKPDRGFFEQAIETVLQDNPGNQRSDIVFLGDIFETDVIGAHDAGISAVWFDHEGKDIECGIEYKRIKSAGELIETLIG